MTQDSPTTPPPADLAAPADPVFVDAVETCFDTADLRLSRAGVTVRRTLEGADRGWSLEFATGSGGPGELVGPGEQGGPGEHDGPDEPAESPGRLRWPLGENVHAVPAALLGLLRARLRGRPLEPVGLSTDSGDFHPSGDEDENRLARLVAELVDLDARVRLNRPDSTEQAWALVRRLAVGLGVSADDAALRFELEWLAQVLATARESRLIAERLPVQLERTPLVDDAGNGVSEAVRRRVSRELDRQQRQSRIAVIQALNSSRYLALLDGLDHFVASHPSWPAPESATDPNQASDPNQANDPNQASDPDVDPVPVIDPETARAAELTQIAGRSHRRMLKALAAEGGPTTPAELDRMLLAVERARSAAEALTQLIGRPARRYTARVAKLQRLLQDRRDQLLIQESLVGLSEKARRAGEDPFEYGRLHAHLDRVLAERDDLGRTFDVRLDDSVARVERRAARLLHAPAGPLGDRATI